MGPRWLGHYFWQFEKVHLFKDVSTNPLQSCLVFHSMTWFFNENLFLSKLHSSYYIILSYLVKNSIQSNMNRRSEKRIGAVREKLSSFTKITREMNQWHWCANNRYTYLGNRWKRLHNYIIWKIELSQPWTFDDDSDCLQFLTSTDVRGRKYWSMFGFPWKNPSENSQRYIKKWVLWYGLEPTIMISTCN